ncbi:MAG: hypothetical protein AW07_01655 [Candidatus Accumulibacter sp. SK-11]|nr:MAG: hypothetical protein AW07_01655 [Candidatus Accumulibacter sp. SK-11]
MDGAADPVATRLCEVQHFLVDALPGDRRITVQQHRQNLVLAVCTTPALPRVNRSDDHRIDDFQVRRVEGQRQMARSARRRDVRRVAHVVFHVASGQLLRLLALELLEQHRRLLAEGVDQNVQPSTVRHPDNDLVDAAGAGNANQLVHRHDRRLASLEREALLTDVAGMQVALECLGCGQPLEHPLAFVGCVAGLRMDALEAVLDPALFRHRADVHVLDADRAAIGGLQRIVDLAESGVIGSTLERAGVEDGVQIGVGEAVIGRVELRHIRTRHALERIEVRPAITNEAVRGDHLQHTDLFPVVDWCCRRRPVASLPRLLGKSIDDRQMRDVARDVARQLRQLVEIVAPLLGNGSRVVEVVLVQLLDKGCVAAKEEGVTKKLIHHGSYLSSPFWFGLRKAVAR